MKWKFDPKTGHMMQVQSPQQEINHALITNLPKREYRWSMIRTLREGLKVCTDFDDDTLKAVVCFNGQWRIIGIVSNLNTIQSMAHGPLVNFHDAWIRGIPVEKPDAELPF